MWLYGHDLGAILSNDECSIILIAALRGGFFMIKKNFIFDIDNIQCQ